MITSPTFSSAVERPTAILCIDNDRESLVARTTQLETAGYQVFPAFTASVAVELFVAHHIDLVLSAIVVPGASGADLSIFMRQVRPEVSVVLLSPAPRIDPILLKQVDACIYKGASYDDLLTCVIRVLGKQFAKDGRTLKIPAILNEQ